MVNPFKFGKTVSGETGYCLGDAFYARSIRQWPYHLPGPGFQLNGGPLLAF